MKTIHIITASTSGNTEFVADTVSRHIKKIAPDIEIEMQKAELAKPEDLLRGDIVILGSGTWNTGGKEGQLNMHMDAFLRQRAADVRLEGKPMTFISLGDERYFFRTRCTEHFLRFQREHGGKLFVPPLIIVNEPYGQEDKIEKWAEKLCSTMTSSLQTPSVDGDSRKA